MEALWKIFRDVFVEVPRKVLLHLRAFGEQTKANKHDQAIKFLLCNFIYCICSKFIVYRRKISVLLELIHLRIIGSSRVDIKNSKPHKKGFYVSFTVMFIYFIFAA